jgi:hypothetical protein
VQSKALVVAVLLALGFVPSGQAAPRDAAARGLDLFIQAPGEVPSGATLPVQVRVFGFPTVATLAPLSGATVEATWDPESLGEKASKVPPPVSIVCDGAGRGHLDIEVPPGRGALKLLVAARFAGHERTHTLDVKRTTRYGLELQTSDTSVVPGGALSAWVLLRDRINGRPVGGKAVDLALKEGSRVRFSRRLTTDRAGTASAEVRVPFSEEPEMTWMLLAHSALGQGDEAEAKATLSVREETPQAPSLKVRWSKAEVRPGAPATFTLAVRDGTGLGIAQLPLRYWVGPRGTAAPEEDKAWLRGSTEIRTDPDGNARVTVETPRTISPRGSSLTVVAKVEIEGEPLTAQATLELATPVPEVEISPEFAVLVPGLAQRLFLYATLDGRPLAAEVAIGGHGLRANVRTNARGFGEVLWRLPAEVGAKVPEQAPTGCAGEVAATVRVRWLSVGAGNPTAKPLDRCLRVDRDVVAVVRPEKPMIRAGEKLHLRILGGQGSASVVLHGAGSEPWQGVWLADAARGGDVTIPATGLGVWSFGATGLAVGKNQNVLSGMVLVLPQVIPRLVAKRGGEPTVSPGSTVTVEVTLDDGHGRPLLGSVGAVVFDKEGGAFPERLLALDTRHALGASAGVAESDIDAFLDGDQSLEIERWAALASPASPPASPAFDPVPTVQEKIEAAFRQIVQSLEGGVFEASSDPERLRDARVRTATGFGLNPELLTLATEAMSETPVTPGGEPWRLADLMSIDPQVKYDNVAKRVTRLKLFNLLATLRSYLFEHKLDRDEPALHDPNALLRRMVHDEVINAGDLLDPWGHGMSYVRFPGPRIPFISTVPGFRLVSAGPDGRFGTADDVSDPFQRVLASRSPYAKAVEEDRIVDAKWDMRVGDETVAAWKALLEEMTGQRLGGASGEGFGEGGLGLLGSGSGGGGSGFGIGRGSLGIAPGSARWLPPVRTDEHGRVRLTVPLGDAETTWQIVLVAMPDDGLPATASVEVPTSLPLSVRANAGAAWIVGDEVEVALRVRNRTDRAIAATLGLVASGAAQLVDARAVKQTVAVPARSATTVRVRVRGRAIGTAVLDATLAGAGHTDRLRHAWQVKPAGEIFVAQNATWIEKAATLPVPAASTATPAQGPSRLVLERGLEPVLAAALDSLAPDHLFGVRALADALEVAGRTRAWALVRGGETHALAVRSRELAVQASERLEVRDQRYPGKHEPPWLRARHWESIANPPGEKARAETLRLGCPSDNSPPLAGALDWLELSAWMDRGKERACWATLRAAATNQLAAESDVLLLARAVLVFADMPGQEQVAAALATRLFAAVPVRPDGALVLPEPLAGDRAARSLVLVAILRTTRWWPADRQVLAGRLWARLRTERDVRGSYGSAEATRHVVAALLRAEASAPTDADVRYTELSDQGEQLGQGSRRLAANGTAALVLSPGTASVRIEASSPGLLARAERPLFRSFHRPVDPSSSPLHVDLSMPKPPVRDGLAALQVTIRHEIGRRVPVRVRIPLPPGAALAERMADTRQVQGAIYVRTELDGDTLPRVIEVPLRFALAGRVTMPEATARVTDDDIAPARAPARPFVIGGR